MKVQKVHIKSFGCQMNKLDSSLLAAALTEEGFELTDKVKDASAILINTCSVREHAEQRVLSHLGHLGHMRKTRPELIVAVIGCMAQRMGAELLEHPAVDIVAGPGQLPKVTDLVKQALQSKEKLIDVSKKIRKKPSTSESQALDDFEMLYDSDKSQIPGQAFVRAMRGCNKFCTYCVVPYVRGPEISRPPDKIIDQIKKLAEQGIKQITLLGQTINSYKYTVGDRTYNLADLLHMISRIEGIKWIRFITSHPKDFDESILHAMAELPKVCPYLHIPAQSGSDKILKAMNRNYTSAQYLNLIAKARDIAPEIAIASDFIVGFPGETDEDFGDTIELVKKAKFKNCFVFKYSPRPGTRADGKLADNVPLDIKKQRNITLLEIQNQISAEYNRRFESKTVEVLVEGPSRKPHLNKADNQGIPQLIGRTATDYIVVFNAPEKLTGEFVNVKIEKTSALTLFGYLAGDNPIKQE